MENGFSRRTKIIATLGPASNTYEKVRDLYHAGANFFRLNMSHGTHDSHRHLYSLVHEVRKREHVDIGVFADLQGPKLRIGKFNPDLLVRSNGSGSGFIPLTEGAIFQFDQDTALGNHNRVCLPHPEIISALSAGDTFLIDDGNVEMTVTEKFGSNGDAGFKARVVRGEGMKDRKGVNVRGVRLDIPSLTDEDKVNMEFALNELGVDAIAQSFVKTPDEVEYAKKLIDGRAYVIAKIETNSAAECYSDICRVSDAVMIARGDLFLELEDPLDTPNLQRAIVMECRRLRIPSIVATQMLESMIGSPLPTRAEINDVSQATYQQCSATMLSGETANGKYPVQAVRVMAGLIERTEDFVRNPGKFQKKYNMAASGISRDPDLEKLPAAVSLPTWQEKRLRGEPVLQHLSSRGNGHLRPDELVMTQ